MNSVQTDALTLKSYNHGEYDRLYVLVTPVLGKVLVRSFSERRAHRLQAGHLQPWLLAQVSLQEKGHGWQLVEAQTTDSYDPQVHTQLTRLHILAELVDRFGMPEQPDAALWSTASLAREMVTTGSFGQLGFVEVLAKVAGAVGLAPNLTDCVLTGETITADHNLGWSSLHGGLVRLGEDQEAYYHIQHLATVKLLRLAASPVRLTGQLRVPSTVVNEAEWLLLDYFQTQLNSGLKSLVAHAAA